MIHFESLLLNKLREDFKEKVNLRLNLLKNKDTSIDDIRYSQGFIAGLEYLEKAIQRFKEELDNQ